MTRLRARLRGPCLLAHRWFGLLGGLLLVSAGLSGALLVFHHELDEALNPALFRVARPGTALSPADLAVRIEAQAPDLVLTWLPLQVEPGHALVAGGVPRDALREVAPAFVQLFVDPVSGALIARRTWGDARLARDALLPWLYRWHYSLALPGEWGVWLMGGVALLWCVDCFVGLYLTLPRGPRPRASARGRWARAWRVKTDAGTPRLVFDAHRAGGLWSWTLLLALAVSAVALSLPEGVVKPLVSRLSPLAPDPFVQRRAAGETQAGQGVASRLSPVEVVARATREAGRAGWTAAPGGLLCDPLTTLCAVRFGDEHGIGLGPRWLYIDRRDGQAVATRVPGQGSAGDVFLALQFPVHSGQLAGLPGRLLVCAGGLATAALGASGVWLWWRRRAQRRASARTSARVLAGSGRTV